MSNLSIDNFKAKLIGGGARSNLFKVIMNFPAFAAGDSELTSYMVKAAQLPSSVISPIIVPFRGRQLPVGGDRTFEPWNLTVINDNNFKVRDAFERWMNGINAHKLNTGRMNPSEYMVDAVVQQLDKADKVVKEYSFKGIWPSNVGPIEVSYDSENQIEEFTVEMQIIYWESQTTS